MTKGIVITEHGYYHEYDYKTVADIQDATKGYFEGMSLYSTNGEPLGYMYINEMGHGLINTAASALSFMFGGGSTIVGNVLVCGTANEDGEHYDIKEAMKEMIEHTCIKREDPVNV